MDVTRLREAFPVFDVSPDAGRMPRRQGLEDSEIFHVYNRGADRQDIFGEDDDQRMFEEMLADLVERPPKSHRHRG